MNAEILSIGTELLLGQIVDTNAAYLANVLANLGINLYFKTTVGDNPQRIIQAMEQACQRADLIITTGGLGPTSDDLTVETIAHYFQEELVIDQPSLEKIKHFFDLRQIPMADNNKKQALRPKGAAIIPNPVGTAPGVLLEKDNKIVISLPGVPKEMYKMVEETVIPFLKQRLGKDRMIIKSRTLRLAGIGESNAEKEVLDLITNQSNPTVAPYAKEFEVHLRLTAKAENESKADLLLNQIEKEVRERLGAYIYGTDNDTLEDLVAKLLREKNQTLAVAESCTGGLISHRLTNIPGISEFLERGIVSYSNTAKIGVLGVDPEIIAQYGAVSKETALAMAKGVKEISKTSLGLAVTGIAGPTGGSEEKPVGLVFISLFTGQGGQYQRYIFPGDRTNIKNRTAHTALFMLKNYLEGL